MCAESIRLHDNPRCTLLARHLVIPPSFTTAVAFNLYDADKDGSITRNEMLQITRIIYKSMGDRNLVTLPDDEATPEQASSFPVIGLNHSDCAIQFVDKIFLDKDLNKDNKLSYQEFVRHMSL